MAKTLLNGQIATNDGLVNVQVRFLDMDKYVVFLDGESSDHHTLSQAMEAVAQFMDFECPMLVDDEGNEERDMVLGTERTDPQWEEDNVQSEIDRKYLK